MLASCFCVKETVPGGERKIVEIQSNCVRRILTSDFSPFKNCSPYSRPGAVFELDFEWTRYSRHSPASRHTRICPLYHDNPSPKGTCRM